ncbi:MAG: RDD family protein, partial [Planctomycetota bacterium]
MEKSRLYPWEFDGETVTFETPEQTKISYRIAPFGTRLVAACLDRLAITLFAVLISFVVLFFFASQIDEFTDDYESALAVAGIAWACWFLFSLFYFVWGEVFGDGRTWGKKRLEIRTVQQNGQPISFGAALIRNLARVVDSLPVFWLVPVFSRGNRRIGDYLASTFVVMDEESEGIAVDPAGAELASTYRELEEKRFFFSSTVSAKLFPDDLNLLDHLQARLSDVP